MRLFWTGKKNTLDLLGSAYRKYRGALYRCAFKILHDPKDAEDVVHDVFCAAIEKRPELFCHGSEKFIARFLLVCTRNRAVDLAKRRQIGARPFDPADLVLRAGTEELLEDRIVDRLYEDEITEKCYSALTELKPIYSDILWLYLEGHSVGEIAAILGVKENTASKRLGRAKEQLKKQVLREGDERV